MNPIPLPGELPLAPPFPAQSVTYIVSLKEAYYFLAGQLRTYDPDPEFVYAILEHLVVDIVETEQERDPVGSHLTQAKESMMDVGMSVNDAFHTGCITGDLIIQCITSIIPNFGSSVYHNAYQYFFRRPYDVYISIQRSVFSAAPLPAPYPPPYRL